MRDQGAASLIDILIFWVYIPDCTFEGIVITDPFKLANISLYWNPNLYRSAAWKRNWNKVKSFFFLGSSFGGFSFSSIIGYLTMFLKRIRHTKRMIAHVMKYTYEALMTSSCVLFYITKSTVDWIINTAKPLVAQPSMKSDMKLVCDSSNWETKPNMSSFTMTE